MTHELDGTYKVTTTTNYQGPLEKQSDGITEIKNGQTHRVDDLGCTWTSTFAVISDSAVKMTSIADASEADPEFMLTLPNGHFTREKVTYEAELKLARKGDKVQISGQIQHGAETIFITMRKG